MRTPFERLVEQAKVASDRAPKFTGAPRLEDFAALIELDRHARAFRTRVKPDLAAKIEQEQEAMVSAFIEIADAAQIASQTILKMLDEPAVLQFANAISEATKQFEAMQAVLKELEAVAVTPCCR